MVAWVLNLAAEEELRRWGRGPLPARIEQVVQQLIPQARSVLLAADDEVVVDDRPARARVGRCWCPTPDALARLERAGLPRPPAPSLEVLRRVNSREFCASLGQTLPGAVYASTMEAAQAVLSHHGLPMLLKRPFAMAGRGQRRVIPPLGADDLAFLDRTLRAGDGIQIEPWLEIEAEFSVHGIIHPGAGVTRGAPCVIELGPRGSFQHARRARTDDLAPHEARALGVEGERVATALGEAGYFGPFGIDAYRHRRGFNPRSEINARYTMALMIGMGGG
jgi:hypothetical protein